MIFTQILLSAVVIFWLGTIFWSVNDIAKISHKKRQQKILWTNIVVIFPFLGLIIYLAYGRKLLSDHQNFVNRW